MSYPPRALRQLRVEFRPESYKWSLIQGMLSRGDRRLTPLLLAARGFGDSLGSYRRAFKVRQPCEVSGHFPLVREAADDGIGIGVSSGSDSEWLAMGPFQSFSDSTHPPPEQEMAGQLPPLEYYVHRDAAVGEEVLPWTHLRGPLPEKTLAAHALEARGHMAEVPTGKFLP